MLENIFVNVFGRSKSSKNSKSQAQNNQQPSPGSAMTGPFSGTSMPQPPTLPYPPAPYPSTAASSFYPQLPFSQHTDDASAASNDRTSNYHRASALNNHIAPLDSVPFETNLTLGSSSNLTSLDNLFKDIKQSADVVDQVDTYLKSNQSEYDFKVERGFLL